MRAWYHIQINTYASWLPGDPRGFRSRGHRIHSTGNYKRPPPADQHAGLRAHAAMLSREAPVELSPAQRQRVLAALVDKALEAGMEVICVSVGKTHAHILGRFEPLKVRSEIGRLKRHSSHAVRDELPGTVWGAKCHAERIRARPHQVRTFRYILAHREKEGAAVWCFRDPPPSAV